VWSLLVSSPVTSELRIKPKTTKTIGPDIIVVCSLLDIIPNKSTKTAMRANANSSIAYSS
jgi:hypothetical protein